MLKLASLMALGLMSAIPAYADTIDGVLRDTTDVSNWEAKFLGIGTAKTWGNDTPVDRDLYVVAPLSTWNKNISWISTQQLATDFDLPGYYSYKTTITEDFGFLGAGQSAVFSELNINFAADNQLRAIIINGTLYDGFDGFFDNNYAQINPLQVSGIDYWNNDGLNTIEFIVYNSMNINSPTGFAAEIQATYTVTNSPVPEPETYAMLLAGIGFIGAVVRRRKSM